MVNIIFVIACLLSLAGSEYVWNGTEWEWQDNKEPSSSDGGNGGGFEDSGVVEGSGDDYDDDYDGEDYDENYNYEDKNEAKVDKSSPTETLHPDDFSSDDEDFVEGSGDSDHDVKESNFGSTDKETESNNGDGGSDIYVEHTDWWDKDNQDHKTVYQEDKNEFNNNGFYDHVDQNENRGGAVNEVPNVYDTAHTTPKTESEVHKKGPTNHHPASFFAQPGILAAVIGGAVVGLLCAILLVMFIIYRMRKKDEGSYVRHDPKPSQNSNPYSGPTRREFYS